LTKEAVTRYAQVIEPTLTEVAIFDERAGNINHNILPILIIQIIKPDLEP